MDGTKNGFCTQKTTKRWEKNYPEFKIMVEIPAKSTYNKSKKAIIEKRFYMEKRARRKKTAYRKRLQNRFSMFLVAMIVLVLVVVVGIGSYGLVQERNALLEQVAENEAAIQKEEQRAEELEEYEKYTHTRQYYEEVAKERLGLVNEDEIIFVQED